MKLQNVMHSINSFLQISCLKKKKVLAKAQKKNMEGQHQTVNNSICDYASLSHPQYVSL